MFRIIHSGENELTCLQDVNVSFQDRSFICHSLEQIMLGSRNDKWSIELDGKTLTNTGLQKQNKIRKVDWFNWDGIQIFQDETEQQNTIVEIPGKYYVKNYNSVSTQTLLQNIL